MFFHRLLFQSLAGWFVGGGAVWAPPNTLFNFFGQIQGQAPKNPQKATRLCHQKGIDGGMFFLPL
ncbi:MAG: hypothetical protein NTW61_06045, partial [Candidatus Melainabacteria bacterium]|nr:hypothetical protein [Candidatus Melainabacteria bacterium]